MRCGDAILELWNRLGNPSDFNPGPCTTVAGIAASGMPLRDALNGAQDVVANWIVSNVRRIRFRALEDSFFFDSQVIDSSQLTVPSWFAAQASPFKVLSLPSGVSGGNNRFADWTINVGGETHRVLRSYTAAGIDYIVLDTPVAAGATLVWTSTPAVLSQRVYAIDTIPLGDGVAYGRRKMELLNVVDLQQQIELPLAAGDDHFVATASTVAVPSSWSKRGGKINFNVGPLDARSYEVRCLRMPLQCSVVDDVYELPDVWLQAMLLRAEVWGNGMLQEPQMAYAKKRDFVELMSQLRDEVDHESDFEQDFIRVLRR